MKKIKKVLLWIVSVYLLIYGLMFFTGSIIAGLLCAIGGLLCNPLILKRINFNKKILIAVVPILFFGSTIIFLNNAINDEQIADNKKTEQTSTTEKITTTEQPTTEEVTTTEEISTTEATTEKKKITTTEKKTATTSTKKSTTERTTRKKVTTTSEPNTKYVETVWLSATGEKYHNKPNCGRMNPSNAREISRSEAESMGYTPCQKCY